MNIQRTRFSQRHIFQLKNGLYKTNILNIFMTNILTFAFSSIFTTQQCLYNDNLVSTLLLKRFFNLFSIIFKLS